MKKWKQGLVDCETVLLAPFTFISLFLSLSLTLFFLLLGHYAEIIVVLAPPALTPGSQRWACCGRLAGSRERWERIWGWLELRVGEIPEGREEKEGGTTWRIFFIPPFESGCQ